MKRLRLYVEISDNQYLIARVFRISAGKNQQVWIVHRDWQPCQFYSSRHSLLTAGRVRASDRVE